MRVLGKVTAAVALTGALVGLGAGTAAARPSVATLSAECGDAGGVWNVEYYYNQVGIRYFGGYSCGYSDISGNYYTDFYDRHGRYTNTVD